MICLVAAFLLAVAALRASIRAEKHGVDISRQPLIRLGIGIAYLGLIAVYGAFEFWGTL